METTGTPINGYAPDFELPGVDEDVHHLSRYLEKFRAIAVIFMCNHCPYVRAIIDRVCRDALEIQTLGIGVAAIMSNDPQAYPEDSYANMQKMAKDRSFPFPYLYDATQDVARAYGAVCTPDFLGFNSDLRLQYRGRLDSSGIAPAGLDAKHELLEAMRQIAHTGQGPTEQIASIGCSIKWRA